MAHALHSACSDDGRSGLRFGGSLVHFNHVNHSGSRTVIKKNPLLIRLGTTSMLLGVSGAAQAFAVETGGVTFSVNGNVNTNYTYVACDKHPGNVTGSLLCTKGAGDAKSSSSSLNSGNLPNGLVFGVKSNISGVDSSVTVGFYPGVVNNDFGSNGGPNLGGTGGNHALASPSLDIRQVFATFSTKELGALQIGRNYSMLGFDAIVNDITLIAVGVASVRTARAPANTTLGTIGFGHLYPTPQAGITYTTPDFDGLKASIGIFQPTDAFTATGTAASSNGSLKSTPGLQGQIKYSFGAKDGFNGFVSTDATYQEQDLDTPGFGAAALAKKSPTSIGGDFTTKLAYGPFAMVGHYYVGSGLGVYSYFIDGFSSSGNERLSNGGYLQGTYTYGKTTFGANYGISRLYLADGDTDQSLLARNSKYTLGVYHKLLSNLTLTSEFTGAESKSHAGEKIKTQNFNVGFFISF